jgi:Holliday junction DNA helicase RuvA
MIAYLEGRISIKTPTYIVIDINGIGYQVHISLHTYAQVEKLERVRLLTHLNIKEDAHTLYGFYSEGERRLFQLLITVSGIGTNTARLILSALRPEEVRQAILSEDVHTFNSVKGIGPKTAKRIILDLKDKMIKESGLDTGVIVKQDNTVNEQALSALLALGFQRNQAQKAIRQCITDANGAMAVENVIKEALKLLS